jgi:Uma2 family endonuclease
MSSAVRRKSWISPEAYLRMELTSEVRHEYCAGEIYPVHDETVPGVAGASVEHNRIAGNIHGELYAHLLGKKCEVFINDMKAHLEARGEEWFYYPDVMVNCDPAGQQKYFCNTPAVIVEVLSPHTERRDKLEKRLAYEMIPALHTYVLVAQDRRELTIFRRAGGEWTREILPEEGGELRIPELEFSISLDAIYARTGL